MNAMLPVNIKLAIRSLSRNPLRTILTMLGIIIGVAAVLTMVALGTGARASVESEVSSAGTNIVFVRSGNYIRGGKSVGIASGLGAANTLIPDDGSAIERQVVGISAISPGVSLRTFVSAGDTREFLRVQGVASNYASIFTWNLSQGRMLVDTGAEEAVLGQALATKLYGSSNPVGNSIQVRDTVYTVVGVTDGQAEDHADVLFVPWQSLQASMGVGHIDSLTLAAEKAGETSRIGEEVKSILRARHNISTELRADGMLEPDDFVVETQAAQALTKGLYTPAAAFALANLPKLDEVTLDEMADTLDRASNTMTALLASIAAVSLIVGGIGIMNIMLVAITERTREIGLRMATGARSGDVAMLFLIESITLSVVGGLIGLVLGLLSAQVVGWSLGWPATISVASTVMAIGIAALVGLIFGIYPARRASLLDPIDALRTE